MQAVPHTVGMLEGGDLIAALRSIPSRFGRLRYLAALINDHRQNSDGPNLGRNWQEVYDEHVAAFEDWLCLSCAEKQADLKVCAQSEGHSVEGLLLFLAQPHNQNDLLPARALAHDRDLFALELAVLFLMT